MGDVYQIPERFQTARKEQPTGLESHHNKSIVLNEVSAKNELEMETLNLSRILTVPEQSSSRYLSPDLKSNGFYF